MYIVAKNNICLHKLVAKQERIPPKILAFPPVQISFIFVNNIHIFFYAHAANMYVCIK